MRFAKMHGLGNDFVVLDGRGGLAAPTAAPTPGLVRRLGDRRRGVGFDQLALIEDAPDADLGLRFWNADGSASAACGNATRCIAAVEMARTGRPSLVIRTARGLLEARDEDGVTAVNMGQPLWGWRDVPLSHDADTDALPLPGAPAATSMGNPHCTFMVDDAEAADIEALGRAFESHPLFPERTNVQAAQPLARDRLRLRVWERGAGLTPASGSSSCAAVVAASRRGLLDRRATVVLDGGELIIDWRRDGVWMAGPTATAFEGVVAPGLLAGP